MEARFFSGIGNRECSRRADVEHGVTLPQRKATAMFDATITPKERLMSTLNVCNDQIERGIITPTEFLAKVTDAVVTFAEQTVTLCECGDTCKGPETGCTGCRQSDACTCEACTLSNY